jgi:hypothetical protein
MARVNVADILVPINDVDQFNHLLEVESENSLIIIDCHQEWCGPCMAIIPFYNQLWIDIDDASKRIIPCTLDISLPNMSKKIQSLVGNEVKLSDQGCRPLFLILRQNHLVGVVNGCTTPLIRMYIDMNIPAIKKKDTEV